MSKPHSIPHIMSTPHSIPHSTSHLRITVERSLLALSALIAVGAAVIIVALSGAHRPAHIAAQSPSGSSFPAARAIHTPNVPGPHSALDPRTGLMHGGGVIPHPNASAPAPRALPGGDIHTLAGHGLVP